MIRNHEADILHLKVMDAEGRVDVMINNAGANALIPVRQICSLATVSPNCGTLIVDDSVD